ALRRGSARAAAGGDRHRGVSRRLAAWAAGDCLPEGTAGQCRARGAESHADPAARRRPRPLRPAAARAALAYAKLERYGMLIVMGLIISGWLNKVIDPVANFMIRTLL